MSDTRKQWDDLTPEQREKVKDCKTLEDILALAQEEGYEISDEELAAISGGDIKWGYCGDKTTCVFH